jgi:hypothetical protein
VGGGGGVEPMTAKVPERSLLLIRSHTAEMFLYPVLRVYVFIFRCSPVNDCRQVPESVGPELIRWLPGRNCRHKELHPSCTQQQCVKETVPREFDRSLFHEAVFSLVMIIAVSLVRIFTEFEEIFATLGPLQPSTT